MSEKETKFRCDGIKGLMRDRDGCEGCVHITMTAYPAIPNRCIYSWGPQSINWVKMEGI